MTASPERSRSDAPAFAMPADRVPPFLWLSSTGGGLFVRCFTRVTALGLENVPTTGPLIIAANHASNTDGGILIAWLTPVLKRPILWMGKAEALEWPVAGWFLKNIGVFGVHRDAADTEAFKLAKSVLESGRVLGAFPEGTRSPTGALQQAKEGATLLALRTGAPVLPVGIAGTDRFWPKGQKMWGFGGRITMRVGEPFVLSRGLGADGRKESLEAVTTRMMERIAALLPKRQRGVYG